MTPKDYAVLFRQIRKARGWTYQQMADYLASQGVPMTQRSAVFHLESRGSQKHAVITAYLALQAQSESETVGAQ